MLEESPLTAADVMTRDVVTALPHTSIRWVARLLADHHISAVPVVDEAGHPVGLISESDLIRWRDQPSEGQAWWLNMLADGFDLSPDFLDVVRSEREKVRAVMTSPVTCVGEATPLHEIARIIADKKIKRVLVARDGILVGIVSRADLIRAMAGRVAAPPLA